jgi:hypothetical protein
MELDGYAHHTAKLIRHVVQAPFIATLMSSTIYTSYNPVPNSNHQATAAGNN